MKIQLRKDLSLIELRLSELETLELLLSQFLKDYSKLEYREERRLAERFFKELEKVKKS